MDGSAIAVVTAWHEAANAGDLDRLTALSSGDVEVGGPRGAGRGAQFLREWVGRANIRLAMRRLYQRDSLVVVEQHAEWRSPESGEVTGSDEVASVFRIQDGQVASVIRHPSLDAALEAAGLTPADEVRPS